MTDDGKLMTMIRRLHDQLVYRKGSTHERDPRRCQTCREHAERLSVRSVQSVGMCAKVPGTLYSVAVTGSVPYV